MPAEPPLSSKYIDVNRTEPKNTAWLQWFGWNGCKCALTTFSKIYNIFKLCLFFPVLSRLLSPTELTWLHFFFFKHMPTFFTEGTSFTGHQKQMMDELDQLIGGDLTAWGRFHRVRRISTKPVRGKSCWGLSHTSAARCRETIRPCLQSLPPVGQLDHVLVLR